MVRALVLVLLAGCQLVFRLDGDVVAVDQAPDTPATPAACNHTGLRLCLTFEDDFGDGLTTDDSPEHLDATISAAMPRMREIPGVASENAVELFAGTMLFNQQLNRFDVVGPRSADVWVNYPAVPLADSVIFDNNVEYTMLIDANGFVHCDFAIDNAPAPPPDSILFPDTFTDLSPNQWHHVACVSDGTNQTIYVDHQVMGPNASKAASGPGYIGTNDLLRFGTQSFNPPGRVFLGQIDNFRLWDRALSATEIESFSNGVETE